MRLKPSFWEQYGAKHRPATVSAEPRIQPCESAPHQGLRLLPLRLAKTDSSWSHCPHIAHVLI